MIQVPSSPVLMFAWGEGIILFGKLNPPETNVLMTMSHFKETPQDLGVLYSALLGAFMSLVAIVIIDLV